MYDRKSVLPLAVAYDLKPDVQRWAGNGIHHLTAATVTGQQVLTTVRQENPHLVIVAVKHVAHGGG